MAAVTPATLSRESTGSLTMFIATFANTVDQGDTWSSGIKGIVAVIASQSDASGTQGSTGAGAAWVSSTGVITLELAEDNTACTLLVFAKS